MIRLVGSLVAGFFVLDGREIGYIEDYVVYHGGERLGEVETRAEAIALIIRRVGQ